MDQQNPLQPPQPPGFPSATDAPPYFTGFLPPQPAPPPSHPSYAEMITEAIVWDSRQGKEGGSSKRAIGKYIDRVYTSLPPSHSSLLTHYLKELKHNGYLVMVKNSYQLASAAAAGAGTNPAPAHTGSALPPPTPDLNTANQPQQTQQEWDGSVDPYPGPKRRPGRPPKRRAEPVQAQENGGGKKRGRPPKQHVIRPHSSQGEHQIMMEPADVPFAVQPETIIAMDGFEPEDQRRRPGRPPKLTPVVPIRKKAHPQVNGPDQAMQESMPVISKRRPGRPPGRKNNVGGEEEGVVAVAVTRRGRPKRRGFGPISRPVGKRPRGRPPRGVGAVVVGKRRGRPPKASGGLPKARRLSASGKPMGRPRKNDASPKLVSEQMENEELTKKLDLIQSKIRDAVDVLRPYIPNENAPLMALQQLQELAAPIVTPPQTAPPVMYAPIPVNMNAPIPVNMNAPPPTGTTSEPPSESVSGAPYTSVPGSFSVNLPQMSVSAPFHVSSSFDNQQRMSWIPSNEEES